MLLHAVVALLMVAVSVLLGVGHLRALRRAVAAPSGDEKQQRFVRGQFRRRAQTSAMIGLVGVLIFAGFWIDQGIMGLVYWCGIVLLVIWIMLLAVVDMIATRIHFARLTRDNAFQQTRLRHVLREAESQRKRQQGNGSADPPSAN